MEDRKRTFKRLEKEIPKKEFDEFARRITEVYATTKMDYTQKRVASDNNVTIKELRKFMDYAIIVTLVPLSLAEKVVKKSIESQKQKVKDSGYNSMLHYRELLKKREEYLSYSYLPGEIKKIAEDISNSNEPLSNFKEKYGLESDEITKKILKRAIEENIVSDETMERIFKRSLKAKDTAYARKYFECLRNQRKKNSN